MVGCWGFVERQFEGPFGLPVIREMSLRVQKMSGSGSGMA